MKKTPTIYMRDFENNPKFVTKDENPECDWVFAGEGVATRKYDGTCCMFDGEAWWKRREVKPGKKAPDDFQQISADKNTGKVVGWVPVVEADKWHMEAISGGGDYEPGTYELCGPKVQGNPEDFAHHIMISHADAEVFEVARTWDAIREWVWSHDYEGLVFHHPDGRMAKIKRRDFPKLEM